MSKDTGKKAPAPRTKPAAKPKAPRMRDVAAEAGVHQTTVSLAFRNHPSIPVETRERIRAIAARMGYRPDPLIDAFNHHRLANHPSGAPVIAVITDGSSRHFYDTVSAHPALISGIRDAATERGYKIEIFEVSPGKLSAARIGQILRARGIQGVIISAFDLGVTTLELEWDCFSCIRIASSHLVPALDTLVADHWAGTRLALRRLRELGYRKVGLAVSENDEKRLADRYRLALLVEQATIPTGARTHPFIFSDRLEKDLTRHAVQWIREQSLDAMMTNHNGLLRELFRSQHTTGLGLASLDLPDDAPELAGIVQNHALVGRRCLEQLTMLMHTHQRGAPHSETVTSVPGYWRDGPSATARIKLY